MERKARPKGRPVQWTEAQQLAQATPGPADKAAAARLWARWAPPALRGLLDAKKETA